MRLFLLIFKTMLIGNAFDVPLLNRLFAAVAGLRRAKLPVGPSCLCSACKIIQLTFARQSVFSQPLAVRFVAQLRFADRCTAFRIFFSDVAFLLALFRRKCPDEVTPYVPLVSLFYATVYPVLWPPPVPGEAEERQQPVRQQKFLQLIPPLVAGFERYARPKAYRLLFPLFAIVLEDYIVLPPNLQEGPLPLVWSAMRHCAGPMRFLYESLFDGCTRASVFEFLVALWATHSVDAPPDFTDEAVYRTVAFLGFPPSDRPTGRAPSLRSSGSSASPGGSSSSR
jgi:hypothetical protein